MLLVFRRHAARHRSRSLLLLLLFVSLSFIVFINILGLRHPVKENQSSAPPPAELMNPDSSGVELAIVLGKTKGENAEWAYDMFPEWTPFIYSVDNEPGYGLYVPNRGHEVMPYLTFIVDHYHKLPGIVAFMHGNNNQWHNEDISPNNDEVLHGLRLETVRRRGYVNLRCRTGPGCNPSSVLPHNPSDVDIERNDTRARFADIYATLFGLDDVKDVPPVIGGICCGQVVATRERILQRPLSDYERMRTWALSGSLPMNDYDVGWVFEKIWHVIFGEGPVSCISESKCLCDLYGKCGEPPTPREKVPVFHPVG
ncbi:hypothetical protein AJ78_01750 [Emergomyces pasteurianus Ep9510]|uniref:Uncharacterized protein n=1 Tax=Emergomyces pasteurianus Ep9510 TaxID=1447872 RepID=A0A1J9PNY6_9EURO|nr:hypothetical protein AJ78_01750 [Emergomyces pasteurianus Ep9510]